MTGRAGLHLTRRAALDIRDIHRRSVSEWGSDVGDRYIADIYAAMARASVSPGAGRLKHHRAAPFLMVPVRKHFVVYDRLGDGIVVLTVLHQARDIESLIADMSPSFFLEIKRLKGDVDPD